MRSISFSVVVYWKGNGWISASWDLMQGDPLSPILFILAVDMLTRMLLRASDVGLIKGERKRECVLFTFCGLCYSFFVWEGRGGSRLGSLNLKFRIVTRFVEQNGEVLFFRN